MPSFEYLVGRLLVVITGALLAGSSPRDGAAPTRKPSRRARGRRRCSPARQQHFLSLNDFNHARRRQVAQIDSKPVLLWPESRRRPPPCSRPIARTARALTGQAGRAFGWHMQRRRHVGMVAATTGALASWSMRTLVNNPFALSLPRNGRGDDAIDANCRRQS
eukprot:scaffold60601_cov32-Tisochrysis_lutea.AAC.3